MKNLGRDICVIVLWMIWFLTLPILKLCGVSSITYNMIMIPILLPFAIMTGMLLFALFTLILIAIIEFIYKCFPDRLS